MSSLNRKTIIAGNWKMHKTRTPARELAHAIASEVKNHKDMPEIVLCPPFTALTEVHDAVRGSHIHVGAQNMDYRDSGAFTGEVSPTMLTDCGAKYVLIGHSERRQFFGETNATVNEKLKAAIHHHLIPVVCVGESLDERESGLTDSVVRRQVGAAVADIQSSALATLVFAYEPVWAIGTGKNCEAEEANRVTKLIRDTISDHFNSLEGTEGGDIHPLAAVMPVLYGGSVKPSNVEELMAKEHIDGALFGGAALKVEDFLPLIMAGQKRKLACAK